MDASARRSVTGGGSGTRSVQDGCDAVDSGRAGIVFLSSSSCPSNPAAGNWRGVSWGSGGAGFSDGGADGWGGTGGSSWASGLIGGASGSCGFAAGRLRQRRFRQRLPQPRRVFRRRRRCVAVAVVYVDDGATDSRPPATTRMTAGWSSTLQSERLGRLRWRRRSRSRHTRSRCRCPVGRRSGPGMRPRTCRRPLHNASGLVTSARGAERRRPTVDDRSTATRCCPTT